MSGPLGRLEVTGPRVRLRPLTAADRPDVEPWLERAVRDAWGRDAPAEPCDFDGLRRTLGGERSALLAVQVPDGDLGGLVACTLDGDGPGWCTFTFLALRPDRRVTGYGGEAVLWLERGLRQAGLATRFRAGVPGGNGLAVYFWLRIGYRPLLRSRQGAGFAPDRTWMVRTEDH